MSPPTTNAVAGLRYSPLEMVKGRGRSSDDFVTGLHTSMTSSSPLLVIQSTTNNPLPAAIVERRKLSAISNL